MIKYEYKKITIFSIPMKKMCNNLILLKINIS